MNLSAFGGSVATYLIYQVRNFSEEFKEGTVHFSESNKALKGLMRYNSFEDQMEFKTNNNDQTQILINLKHIDSVILDGQTCQYLKYEDDENMRVMGAEGRLIVHKTYLRYAFNHENILHKSMI